MLEAGVGSANPRNTDEIICLFAYWPSKRHPRSIQVVYTLWFEVKDATKPRSSLWVWVLQHKRRPGARSCARERAQESLGRGLELMVRVFSERVPIYSVYFLMNQGLRACGLEFRVAFRWIPVYLFVRVL